MVPIKGEWKPFSGQEEKLKYLRLWGLIPPKSKVERPVMVTDGYFGIPQPCEVVGYKDANWAVIELPDGYHAIFGEYLAEMQPQAYQKLPYGMCFTEVLRDYIAIDIKTSTPRPKIVNESNRSVSRETDLPFDYIVFDIETTGFSREHHEIIEFAAIRYCGRVEKARYHTLIKPSRSIPKDITALTGITNDDVADAPVWENAADNIREFIGKFPLVGHNIKTFDIPFLEAKYKHPLGNRVIDTLYYARKAFPELPSHKLEILKEFMGFGDAVSHRADVDVEITHELFLRCIDSLGLELSGPCETDNAIEMTGISAIRYSYGKEAERFQSSTSDLSWVNVDAAFMDFAQTLPIVGHNISDGALLDNMGLSFNNTRIDTLPMARKAFPLLPYYDLDYLNNALLLGVADVRSEYGGAEAVNALLWANLAPKRHERDALNAYVDHKMGLDAQNDEDIDISNDKQSEEPEQVNLFDVPPTDADAAEMNEHYICAFLKPYLIEALERNCVGSDSIKATERKQFTSVCYLKPEQLDCDGKPVRPRAEALAFRIISRKGKHAFEVADNGVYRSIPFIPTPDHIEPLIPTLVQALENTIDAGACEYSCCSRVQQCSDACRCVNPYPYIAANCNYRKVLKSGRVFYGKNRNID